MSQISLCLSTLLLSPTCVAFVSQTIKQSFLIYLFFLFFFDRLFKYVNSRRSSKETLGLIQIVNQQVRVEKRWRRLMPQFLIVMRSWATQSQSELEDHDWGSSYFPLMATKIVRDQLYQLNVHKGLLHTEGFSRCYSQTHSLPKVLGVCGVS